MLLIFAQSLTLHPPGHLVASPTMVHALIALGGMIFVMGLRLVLPLLGLLLMVEISLALLARLNAQLHLITLSFPIKMLLSLVLLAWLVSIFPKVFTQSAGPVLQVVRGLLSS